MKKIKLFTLENRVWRARDWYEGADCNPIRRDYYLFNTEEKLKSFAQEIEADDEVYNDGSVYEGTIAVEDILEASGVDTLEEFCEMLAEPYSHDCNKRNLGEFEKEEVAKLLIDNHETEYLIGLPNYDQDESIEGSIVVVWRWDRYVGYSRTCEDVRVARYGETKQDLCKDDSVRARQMDVVLAANEVEGLDEADVRRLLVRELLECDWKWSNPDEVMDMINVSELSKTNN